VQRFATYIWRMDKDVIADIGVIKLEPDFEVIKKYLYQSVSDRNYKAFIRKYRSKGSLMTLPFMSDVNGDTLAVNIANILNKYPLTGHRVNLAFVILTIYKQTYNEMFEGRLPSMNSLRLVDSVKSTINFILKNKHKKMKITFETIPEEVNKATKKNSKLVCNETQITNWLTSVLSESILTQGVPISIGQFMINSYILGRVEDKTEYLQISPSDYYEESSFQTIATDAIMEVAIRVIAYIQGEGLITKGKAKHWSFEQLSLVADVLIALGYLQSSQPNYKVGISEPTVEDKKYLDSTLNNKLNQRKLMKVSSLDAQRKSDM